MTRAERVHQTRLANAGFATQEHRLSLTRLTLPPVEEHGQFFLAPDQQSGPNRGCYRFALGTSAAQHTGKA